MTPHSLHRIGSYARHFFSGTLLSRISGMVRDISMAALFGDHPSVAAFMVSFRFAHFFRRILGEGALQSIFIPHYQEVRLKDEGAAQALLFRLTFLIALFLTLLILVVEGIVASGLFFNQGSEVVHLFSWMLPSLLFICLYGLNVSVLQCQNSFFLSSVAPLSCNLVWILSLFAFSSREAPEAMILLALFTGVGFLIQWLLTLGKTAPLLRSGMRQFRPPYLRLSSEIKTIGKATLFGLLGIAAVQINSFLDMIFARWADLKGPIYLWYAIRIEQLPLALIGLACVYSVIPSLSKLIKAGATEEAKALFLFGKKHIFLLVIPSTLALFALGFSSVNLLFGRGQFSHDAVSQTTFCLWAYALGLLPSTLTLYQSSLFYAYGDYKTPTLASLGSVLLNIVLNCLFVFLFHLGAISIALSTSVSALFNYLVLKIWFKREEWRTCLLERALKRKILAASLAGVLGCMALELCLPSSWFFWREAGALPRAILFQLLSFTAQLFVFCALFFSCLFVLCKDYFNEIKNLIFPQTKNIVTP